MEWMSIDKQKDNFIISEINHTICRKQDDTRVSRITSDVNLYIHIYFTISLLCQM